MVTEWDLVCENSWLKTLAKMLLFTGFALGSFCSGLVSDRQEYFQGISKLFLLSFVCLFIPFKPIQAKTTVTLIPVCYHFYYVIQAKYLAPTYFDFVPV